MDLNYRRFRRKYQQLSIEEKKCVSNIMLLLPIFKINDWCMPPGSSLLSRDAFFRIEYKYKVIASLMR